MERHQRLQRVRAGLRERTDVFADQTAFPDVDQLLGGLALLPVKLVFVRDRVEAADDALPQLRAVARFEEQLVQPIRLRRRMLVELEAFVLEMEASELFRDLRR